MKIHRWELANDSTNPETKKHVPLGIATVSPLKLSTSTTVKGLRSTAHSKTFKPWCPPAIPLPQATSELFLLLQTHFQNEVRRARRGGAPCGRWEGAGRARRPLAPPVERSARQPASEPCLVIAVILPLWRSDKPPPHTPWTALPP